MYRMMMSSDDEEEYDDLIYDEEAVEISTKNIDAFVSVHEHLLPFLDGHAAVNLLASHPVLNKIRWKELDAVRRAGQRVFAHACSKHERHVRLLKEEAKDRKIEHMEKCAKLQEKIVEEQSKLLGAFRTMLEYEEKLKKEYEKQKSIVDVRKTLARMSSYLEEEDLKIKRVRL